MDQIMNGTPPDNFVCPLTLEVMEDPVQHYSTKHNFERGAIMHWILFGNATCPLTRQPLDPSDFEVNHTLRQDIRAWRGEEQDSGVELPEAPEQGREESTPSSPKKHFTKKEKAILKKLRRLRQSRAQTEATSCQ